MTSDDLPLLGEPDGGAGQVDEVLLVLEQLLARLRRFRSRRTGEGIVVEPQLGHAVERLGRDAVARRRMLNCNSACGAPSLALVAASSATAPCE